MNNLKQFKLLLLIFILILQNELNAKIITKEITTAASLTNSSTGQDFGIVVKFYNLNTSTPNFQFKVYVPTKDGYFHVFPTYNKSNLQFLIISTISRKY